MASLRSAVVLATVVAAAGCVAGSGDNSLFILANAAPSDGCSFDNSTSGPVFDSGRYDVGYLDPLSSSGSYVAAPLIQNLTLVDSTSSPELITRRTANMKGVHVTLSFTNDDVLSAADVTALKDAGLTQFDARFAGTIAPNLGARVFPVEVVPNQVLQKIRVAIVAKGIDVRVGIIARLVAFGDIAGSSVDSSPFELPIDVCVGCLTQDHGLCANLPQTFMPRTGGLCDFRQDGVVDCCNGAIGEAVCPAVVPGGT